MPSAAENDLEPYMRVLVGTNNLFVGGQSVSVVRAVLRTDYDDQAHVTDIALLEIGPKPDPPGIDYPGVVALQAE